MAAEECSCNKNIKC